MTSRFSAVITLDAGPRARALRDSMRTDTKYYAGPDTAAVSGADGSATVTIHVRADRLPHLRAGVNGMLRLAKAADAAIESAVGASPGGRARPAGETPV